MAVKNSNVAKYNINGGIVLTFPFSSFQLKFFIVEVISHFVLFAVYN